MHGLSPHPPAAASLAAAAQPARPHNPPPHWVRQLPPYRWSSPSRLPVSAPPPGLGECFFFISLAVGLPYSSMFCQFWLFFAFKLLLSFFWLCKEAQCIYLHLHLGRKSDSKFSEKLLKLFRHTGFFLFHSFLLYALSLHALSPCQETF